MFINFTNHDSSMWSEEQTCAARAYGSIKDIPFPAVDPSADEAGIHGLAEHYADIIAEEKPSAVLCQGETSLSFAVTQLLKEKGITVLCAASVRTADETVLPDGAVRKSSVFRFVRFRRI